jgi:hypothetical protein
MKMADIGSLSYCGMNASRPTGRRLCRKTLKLLAEPQICSSAPSLVGKARGEGLSISAALLLRSQPLSPTTN